MRKRDCLVMRQSLPFLTMTHRRALRGQNLYNEIELAK